ncbi:hypothetical protein E1180_07795, partial [Roseibium denhamense]
MEIVYTVGMMALCAAVFGLVVWLYFRVANHFSAETRPGGLRGDGFAILLALGLIVVFIASYIEIFVFAFL